MVIAQHATTAETAGIYTLYGQCQMPEEGPNRASLLSCDSECVSECSCEVQVRGCWTIAKTIRRCNPCITYITACTDAAYKRQPLQAKKIRRSESAKPADDSLV